MDAQAYLFERVTFAQAVQWCWSCRVSLPRPARALALTPRGSSSIRRGPRARWRSSCARWPATYTCARCPAGPTAARSRHLSRSSRRVRCRRSLSRVPPASRSRASTGSLPARAATIDTRLVLRAFITHILLMSTRMFGSCNLLEY